MREENAFLCTTQLIVQCPRLNVQNNTAYHHTKFWTITAEYECVSVKDSMMQKFYSKLHLKKILVSKYCCLFSQQSYSEPVDVKASQPPQMINSKQSVFHGPAQAPSALYLSSHYHQQPGMNPHITAMHANIPRNIAPKPNNQMPVTVSIANMAVSPPPPLQISPPLHQHLNIQQHQPITMQQSIGNQLPMQVQSALHSPTMQQVSCKMWFFSGCLKNCFIFSISFFQTNENIWWSFSGVFLSHGLTSVLELSSISIIQFFLGGLYCKDFNSWATLFIRLVSQTSVESAMIIMLFMWYRRLALKP